MKTSAKHFDLVVGP